MKLTLVRHATLLLDTESHGRVLVDPMLDPAGTRPPIEDTPNDLRNPLVELPLPAADVVAGVDLCIVTHLHSDHFDAAAAAALPRSTPILTQPESAAALRRLGFVDVRTADERIPMTRGRHGTGELGDDLGPVSGWVLDGVYLAGDTVWCDDVANALAAHSPRAVVVHGGGARFVHGDPIVMDAADVRRVRAATDAPIVVVHLEAINHCVEPRDAYRGLPGVHVPADGEMIELP
ncbi:MAG TPA: MBL fold metallo-hydrolase [Gaiellaceae bacterium]|nr:MBL fold metallo-hydrolase [Gaiellaceae bacterium]